MLKDCYTLQEVHDMHRELIALRQAKESADKRVVNELWDLLEYMSQFPDDLNLGLMKDRIDLIEKEIKEMSNE